MKRAVIAFATVLFAPLGMLVAADKTELDFAAMPPAKVRQYEIDVMRKIADPALIPLKLNAAPTPKYDYDRLDYGMTIGIERPPLSKFRTDRTG